MGVGAEHRKEQQPGSSSSASSSAGSSSSWLAQLFAGWRKTSVSDGQEEGGHTFPLVGWCAYVCVVFWCVRKGVSVGCVLAMQLLGWLVGLVVS